MATPARRAPPGFTPQLWSRFLDEGYLLFPDVLDEAACARYRAALARVADADPGHKPGHYWHRQNAVEADPVLAELIDRESHIGFAYDLYGELTKVHLSQVMRRPRGGGYNLWHPDGGRALPYQVFSPVLPLQFKVAYWLTDLPRPDMGNLVVLPRSHGRQVIDGYDTRESLPGEVAICARPGTMLLMHCSLWHRVADNASDQVRENIFLTYSPSWLSAEDRYQNDPAWLSGLSRERRILMRSYQHPYDNAKPPAADFPLYLDRETGADRDPGVYRDHVELHRRKRLTFHERLALQARG